MKQIFAVTAMAVALAASAFATDYEVTIDGKIYTFTQGVEQRIILHNGQRVSMSVSPVKTKEFREHGISFSYLSDMKIGQDSFYGIKQVTAETTDSTLFMLQIFPAGTTPTELRRDLLAGFRKEFGNMGARFPAKPTESCERIIGGVKYQGVKLLYALGGLAHESEIYTMDKNGKTLGIVFQYAAEDKQKAMPLFKVIATSLK